jgi:hypothetical protein
MNAKLIPPRVNVEANASSLMELNWFQRTTSAHHLTSLRMSLPSLIARHLAKINVKATIYVPGEKERLFSTTPSLSMTASCSNPTSAIHQLLIDGK